MPFTTSVAGSVITASWANLSIRNQVVTPFASSAARTTAIGAVMASPIEGMVSYRSDAKVLEVYDATGWVQMQPVSAVVAALETTASSAYTDLATPGPAVSVQTGTSALVMVTGKIKCSVPDAVYMGYAVSGATAIAATLANAILVVGTSQIGTTGVFLQTGLTPGVNTFTSKYRIGFSGTLTAQDRNITVIPLP